MTASHSGSAGATAPARQGAGSAPLAVRNLDALKWFAAVAMLVDHLWLYVFGATYWSEAAGSLAFPLFAIALAEGTRTQNAASRDRTMLRLLLGALVCQAFVLTVRDALPLNVIFTLAAGVALDTAWRNRRASCVAVAVIAFAAIGFVCEYNHPGILFAFVAMRWCATRSTGWGLAFLVGLAALAPFNANHWALAAPAVAVVFSLLPRDTPRVRDAFYIVYALQWPLIAALQSIRA